MTEKVKEICLCENCNAVFNDMLVCEECGTELTPTGLTASQCTEYWTQCRENLPITYTREECVIFEKARVYSTNQFRKGMEEGQNRCPNCGSSDFQMVQRKYSLLTGFFTNKVDRVCTSCKKRF